MSEGNARPRWRCVANSGRFFCGMAIIALGVPIVHLLAEHSRANLAVAQSRDQRFEQEGVATNARITGKSEIPQRGPWGPTGESWWVVSYNYRDADGRLRYGFLQRLPKDAWDHLREGDELAILYLASEPETSRPVAEERYSDPWILTTLEPIWIVAIVAIGLLLVAWAIFRAGRQGHCPKCGGTGKVQIPLANHQGTVSSSCTACWGQGIMGNGEAAEPAAAADRGP